MRASREVLVSQKFSKPRAKSSPPVSDIGQKLNIEVNSVYEVKPIIMKQYYLKLLDLSSIFRGDFARNHKIFSWPGPGTVGLAIYI
ncbi:MAG: hypothetical protein LBT38_03625 [Deltaproteobacteria bacterium]|nr:hypothetical protein [Deltaproteobacteria bacterium]